MLSVVINTFNEENNLPKAIASVKDLADEVVVVDMQSADATVKVAKELGAKVFSFESRDYVEPARNFAISKSNGDWVLVLDADEQISLTLKKKIEILLDNPKADYYRLPRKNIVLRKWMKHSRWWPDYNIRLFRKGFVSWSEVIHAVPVTTGEGWDLEATEENAIIHNHYNSFEQYIDRMNKYTTVQAKDLLTNGYKFSWPDVIKKPTGEFLSRFYFGEGYKDGMHGLALSGLQAFSEFLVYLKVWSGSDTLIRKQSFTLREVAYVLSQAVKDLYYWQADALVKKEGGFINRIKRKFRLA